MASAGDFPWGDGAWDAVFALEVTTGLRPFPSHPFPSLGAPATAPGGDWIPRQGRLATPQGPGLEGVMLRVVKALGCGSRQRATCAMCPSRHPRSMSRHRGGVAVAAGSRRRPPLR